MWAPDGLRTARCASSARRAGLRPGAPCRGNNSGRCVETPRSAAARSRCGRRGSPSRARPGGGSSPAPGSRLHLRGPVHCRMLVVLVRGLPPPRSEPPTGIEGRCWYSSVAIQCRYWAAPPPDVVWCMPRGRLGAASVAGRARGWKRERSSSCIRCVHFGGSRKSRQAEADRHEDLLTVAHDEAPPTSGAQHLAYLLDTAHRLAVPARTRRRAARRRQGRAVTCSISRPWSSRSKAAPLVEKIRAPADAPRGNEPRALWPQPATPSGSARAQRHRDLAACLVRHRSSCARRASQGRRAATSPAASTGSPPTAVITSPTFRPAFAAALSGRDRRLFFCAVHGAATEQTGQRRRRSCTVMPRRA